jgi:hypothetical protein
VTDTAIQPTAVVSSMGALLAALHAKQQALGWSNQFVREVSGIDVAEVFENGRRPSVAVVDALMSLFAVSLSVVPDPAKAAVLSEWWNGDRASRAEPFRGSERARRAALARWARTSPEERARVAGHAGRARWAKERRNVQTTIADT